MTRKQFRLRLLYSLLLGVALVLFFVAFAAARLKDVWALLWASIGCLVLLMAVIVLAAVDLRGVAQARLRHERELQRALHDTLAAVAAKRGSGRSVEGAPEKDPGNGRT